MMAGGKNRAIEERRPNRARNLRILVWIVLGIALRVTSLSGDGLWCDEGYTAWTAHLSQEAHEQARQNDDAPPLYYGLQRLLVPNLPPGERSVRILSAAAGVAGILWLAVQPPFAGLIEAPVAFLAVGTYGVYYGRLARSYTILILFGLILLTAVTRVAGGRRRWLLVVALVEGLALWTHNVAATLVVGVNLAWLLSGRRDPFRWLASQAGAFLIWLPYLLTALPQFAVHASLNRWIGDFWETVPIAAAPFLSLASFTSGAKLIPSPPTERWFYDGPGAVPLAVVSFAAVALLLASAFRGGRGREARIAASFTLGPLLTLTLLSIVTSPSYILARTDAVAYGGFIVWTALGLRALPRWGKSLVLLVLGLTTLLTIATRLPVAGRQRGNDRTIGRRLQEEVRPGDWVAFVGLARPSIDYYLSGGRPGTDDGAIHRLQFPASTGKNPAAVYPVPAESLRIWEAEAIRVRKRFEAGNPVDSYLYYVGPIDPQKESDPTAADLPYPGNLLAYALGGLRPLDPILRLRGDGMGTDWICFRVRRDRLVPVTELVPVEEAP